MYFPPLFYTTPLEPNSLCGSTHLANKHDSDQTMDNHACTRCFVIRSHQPLKGAQAEQLCRHSSSQYVPAAHHRSLFPLCLTLLGKKKKNVHQVCLKSDLFAYLWRSKFNKAMRTSPVCQGTPRVSDDPTDQEQNQNKQNKTALQAGQLLPFLHVHVKQDENRARCKTCNAFFFLSHKPQKTKARQTDNASE